MTTISPDDRSCTCHPDDRPPVCQKRYAASECQTAYRLLNCLKHGPHDPGECPQCDELAEARMIVSTTHIPPAPSSKRHTPEDIVRDLRTWDGDADIPRGPDGLLRDAADLIEQLLAKSGTGAPVGNRTEHPVDGSTPEGETRVRFPTCAVETKSNVEQELLRRATEFMGRLFDAGPDDCDCEGSYGHTCGWPDVVALATDLRAYRGSGQNGKPPQ